MILKIIKDNVRHYINLFAYNFEPYELSQSEVIATQQDFLFVIHLTNFYYTSLISHKSKGTTRSGAWQAKPQLSDVTVFIVHKFGFSFPECHINN